MSRVYIVDIDNTITKTEGEDYENAQPIPERISILNEYHKKGHKIIYATARGQESGKNYETLTRKQLKEWGANYHSLIEKPYADVIVDDKAHNSEKFF